jgi:hypothetical protein
VRAVNDIGRNRILKFIQNSLSLRRVEVGFEKCRYSCIISSSCPLCRVQPKFSLFKHQVWRIMVGIMVGTCISTGLDLGTKGMWMVNFTPWPLYPRRNRPRYSLDRKLSGPDRRFGLYRMEITNKQTDKIVYTAWWCSNDRNMQQLEQQQEIKRKIIEIVAYTVFTWSCVRGNWVKWRSDNDNELPLFQMLRQWNSYQRKMFWNVEVSPLEFTPILVSPATAVK